MLKRMIDIKIQYRDKCRQQENTQNNEHKE
jgi:hypothetical protein